MAPGYLIGLIGQFLPYGLILLLTGGGAHALGITENVTVENSFFSNLMGKYGLYAVFFLTMWEGDITLLLAGVFAHHGAFGEYGFAQVLGAGTLGGVVGDSIAYGGGRGFERSVRGFRF